METRWATIPTMDICQKHFSSRVGRIRGFDCESPDILQATQNLYKWKVKVGDSTLLSLLTSRFSNCLAFWHSKFSDVDICGVGSEGAREVAAALQAVVGEVESAHSPLKMNEGQGDFLGNDFDLSNADPSDHTA